MPRHQLSVDLKTDCASAFAIVHDYDRRLQWDTLLKSAELLDGARAAGVGVRSRCVGTARNGWIPMETEYITFEPGRVAAVRLTNRPPFFDPFAASIRHLPLAPDRSRVTYTFSFRVRPRRLRRVLEPILTVALRRETRKRLDALSAWVKGACFPPPTAGAAAKTALR